MTEKPSLTAALETVKQTPAQKNIRDLIEGNAVELAKKLPRGLEFEYFKQAVYSEMRRNPKLQECDPLSMLGAVVQALQLGLSPGVLGLVYFVPFKKEVQFILGYKGMIELAYRSERVLDVNAELVYEGDVFHPMKGTSPKIVHEDAGPPGERTVTHAYAVAHLKSKGTVSKVIYPEDWEKAKAASAAGSKGVGPWVDHWQAMVRKTAVRRLQPFLPQSPQLAASYRWDETAAPDPLDETADVVIEGG